MRRGVMLSLISCVRAACVFDVCCACSIGPLLWRTAAIGSVYVQTYLCVHVHILYAPGAFLFLALPVCFFTLFAVIVAFDGGGV